MSKILALCYTLDCISYFTLKRALEVGTIIILVL